MLTAITIFLGLLPGFAWLLFYLQEDIHPEPKKMIAKVFFAGAISSIAALALEIFASCLLVYRFYGCTERVSDGIELTPLLIVAFAFIEEIAKFLAAFFVVAKSKYFDEPVDAMVYMAVAALGFATVENLGALSGQGTPLIFNDIFQIATFRFVGTTLLHTLTASIIGYFWALEIRNFKSGKMILWGLFWAVALHAVFNYLILAYSNLLYPIIFVAIVGFFMLSDFEKLKRREL
ncbi:MAG: PrsW family intramembrane metalloprotease [Candidatus Liptonbacteria bacterium]|nr:PrsW family intramembrane metalloprotease [Candidatus Liptonbacteria bacterium]